MQATYGTNEITVRSIKELEEWRAVLLYEKLIKKPEDLKVSEEELSLEADRVLREDIDESLVKEGITQREQIITTANGTQLALYAVAIIIKYLLATGEAKEKLKTQLEKLAGFANVYLKSTPEMPIGFLGKENTAMKVIELSVVSGQIVKKVVTDAIKKARAK